MVAQFEVRRGVLRLEETDESLIIDQPATGKCITIDRLTGKISESSHSLVNDLNKEVITLYGIIGLFGACGRQHLIVVTEADQICDILGHSVMKMVTAKIIPLNRSTAASTVSASDSSNSSNSSGTSHVPKSTDDYEREYIRLVMSVLSTPSFYFSVTLDLTHKIQDSASRGNGRGEGGSAVSSHYPSEGRFFWNEWLSSPFAEAGFSSFVLPLVHGFITSRNVTVANRRLTLALISRRSKFRAGTRFTVRGVDAKGNVANFVETEQIVVVDSSEVFSHIQIRGSIPVHWTQLVNLKYAPPIAVDGNPSGSAVAARAHFDELLHHYGDQAIVSLVNLKGKELAMARAFEAQMQHLRDPRLPFFPFDFHKECSKMRYERLGILMDRIAPHLDKHGWYHASLIGDSNAPSAMGSSYASSTLLSTGNVHRSQSGTIRTNCMDCLDRTNVFQSVIARRILAEQLAIVGCLPSKDTPLTHNGSLESSFKSMWADNGDAVSTQYSGTGALKADFTRTGKRTLMGYVEDGKKSLMRYYLNNLRDGERKDAMDIFLGVSEAAVPTRPGSDPFEARKRSSSAFTASIVSILCLFLALIASLFATSSGLGLGFVLGSENMNEPENDGVTAVRRLSWIAFWSLSLFIAFRAIQKNGRRLVDAPRFNMLPLGPASI